MRKKILICFGTRPEAIKLAPVVQELRRRPGFDVLVCVTAQHRQMLDQVLDVFDLAVDHDLDVMRPDQTLEGLTGLVLGKMAGVLDDTKPDCIVVQGDTTTSFAAALTAFYHRIPVAHVEAGLRTYSRYAPFPEEINRQMTACLTTWHFAPTRRAAEALIAEGRPPATVFCVGNTVIDALLGVAAQVRERNAEFSARFPAVARAARVLLMTGHRRENFGQGFVDICRAIAILANANPDLAVVYPVHLNPNVQRPVRDLLGEFPNVHLIEPQDYRSFIWLLDRCEIVLTDSGGVQEEAPSLGKPVLVMRETTERPEAVEAGVAKLVGTDVDTIVSSVQRLLDDPDAYARMSRAQNPYGDGTSAAQIADILEREWHLT